MKKAARLLLTSVPMLGAAGGVGGYMLYQYKQSPQKQIHSNQTSFTSPDSVTNSNNNQQDDQSLLSRFKIFPQINAQQFYKYIKMRDGKPYMDDIFIAQVVNKVLKDIQISDGHIEWAYTMNDQKDDLKLTFKWLSDGQGRVFTKTYRLNISKSV